jgi:hypothetical protein
MKSVDCLELSREICLAQYGCRIEDRISGDLKGKSLLFSVRYFPRAAVYLKGLRKVRSEICWGSDGRQILDLYEASGLESEIRYECFIELNSRPSSLNL